MLAIADSIPPRENMSAPDDPRNCKQIEFPELTEELRLATETVLSIHLIS